MPHSEVRPWAPDDVLTIEQLAERLQLSARAVERLDLPSVYCGRGKVKPTMRRFLWGMVVETLKSRAA